MSPLKIAIHIDGLLGAVPGGQGRVILNLIRELSRIDRGNQYTLFGVRDLGRLPEELRQLPANFRLQQLPAIKPQLLFLLWHTLRRPPVDLGRWLGPQDVIHATMPGMVPACKNARLVLTVYDLVCWKFPDGLNRWGRFFHRSGLRIGAREATLIATISEATRQDLLAHFGSAIDAGRVHTLPIAANADFQPVLDSAQIDRLRQKFGIQGQYIINIGTLEPRKNLERLLRAYATLPATLRADYTLVIVGPYGWKLPAVQQLIDSLGLQHQVVWTGHLPDHEMNTLLSGATVFAYPSLYEGFGIPLLEAMQCDVPILTSRISSLPEVAGDAALLVEPTEISAIAGGLRRLLEDAALRAELVERGRRQRMRFSYRAMAEQYVDLYQAAIKHKPPSRT
ncbi:MAG TPA: glycosyltransferase family 1 protein [Herpetosiphonaceae bacterium]